MRLRRADVVAYGGAVDGARGAIETWSERRGLLVRLVDADGYVAQGEASPLPRYSRDTLDGSRTALARLDWSALPEAENGEHARVYLERLALSLGGLSEAARFAVETALLDRLGQRRGLPIWALLAETGSPAPVPLSCLAGGADEAGAVARARLAVERGVGTVKLKIAGPKLGAQLATLARVREAIGSCALRLDANGSLDAATAEDELTSLRAVEPELVEEPVGDLAALAGSPVPLGLDESLRDPGIFERLAPRFEALRCAAVILKPTALGGFHACLALAARAQKAGLDVTVSHTFDGPVAFAAAAHLALAVASRTRASGLDAHAGLAAWPRVTIPLLGPTTVVAAEVAGLGVRTLPGPP
jgi:L-alanine-DL-glutamate epimerase-like enolase superfamily enzyme